jgi:hypothetical protein
LQPKDVKQTTAQTIIVSNKRIKYAPKVFSHRE